MERRRGGEGGEKREAGRGERREGWRGEESRRKEGGEEDVGQERKERRRVRWVGGEEARTIIGRENTECLSSPV